MCCLDKRKDTLGLDARSGVIMKKGELVKGNSWMFNDYGVGIVLASDGLGSLKIYWPSQKFWCITVTKNVVKIRNSGIWSGLKT